MSTKIRKGAREYHFHRQSNRRHHFHGRRLSAREASGFVRSLHSREEQNVLRRLAYGLSASMHRRGDGLISRVTEMLHGGQLEIWVVDGARGSVRNDPGDGDEAEADAPPPIEPPDNHTVVIELVDVDGNPVPYEPYRIKLPDGRVQTRSLDRHGRDRVTGIREAGNCQVCFHERDAAVWSRA